MRDLHAHILPGVDDGARTLIESVEMVRGLAELGITEVVATPHYIHETSYASPRVENQRRLEELQEALAAAEVEIKVELGNEIYIDSKISELLATGVVATLGGSRDCLVELPMSGEAPNAQDILLALMQEGYHVILAHPERYTSVQQDYDVALELNGAGVLLQCNLGSLAGKYGKKARKVAEFLVREGKVFGFGSDAHRVEDLRWVAKGMQRLAKLSRKG